MHISNYMNEQLLFCDVSNSLVLSSVHADWQQNIHQTQKSQ